MWKNTKNRRKNIENKKKKERLKLEDPEKSEKEIRKKIFFLMIYASNNTLYE